MSIGICGGDASEEYGEPIAGELSEEEARVCVGVVARVLTEAGLTVSVSAAAVTVG